MTEIHRQQTTTGDCLVHYLEAGAAAEKTVVLLHGKAFSSATWRDLGTIGVIAELGFRVLALDMPGFGESPECGSAPAQLLDDFLGGRVSGRVTLVGPSMGGRTALEYAIAFPDAVDKLVLVGAAGVDQYRDQLSSVAVPVLVVWGSVDTIFPLAKSEILMDRLPQARRVVFPGARHPCYLDAPEKWHETLTRFLLDG